MLFRSQVERGQRVGLIKFGSRVDVLAPAEALVRVKVGERVQGGSSVIAVMPEAAAEVITAVAAQPVAVVPEEVHA